MPLNYICAVTTSVYVLLIACLLIGFVRIMVMLNCTFTIAPYLTGMDTLAMFTMKEKPSPEVQYSLERKRTFLMPVLYTFILAISQASNLLVSWFAYEYRWQDAYIVVVGMLAEAMLLIFITMPSEKRSTAYKPEWRKVPEMLLMAGALCVAAYMLVFGKTLDWFQSPDLRFALGLLLVLVAFFLLISIRNGDEAYLPLASFSYRNVWMSMLLFLLTMVLNSANVFVSTFAKISTAINNVQSASLSAWAIVGCVAGLFTSLMLIAKKVKFRLIFCVGFFLMAASNVYLYFQYQTMGLFSNMAIPTILNYAGLLILYSVVAAFGMKKLPSRFLATFVFLMIWMRNAIAPVVGSSIYSNWLNGKQQYYISRLVQNVDMENPLAASAFVRTARVGQAGGKGTDEAQKLATTSMKAQVAKQATITAMKDITGDTVMLLAGAIALTVLLPYAKNETT